MTPLARRNLKQDAIYWELSVEDENGNRKVKNPVPYKARWEYKTNLSKDPNGDTTTTECRVYLPCLVSIGSLLWEGTFTKKPADSELTDIMEIVTVGKIPDIKGKHPIYYADCNRYKNEIPLESS